METIDIEAIQQELQKHGLDRLEPNDPLFIDHLARRLELHWHYEKIQTLLEQQQKQIQDANTEFAESLRKAYSEWITEGGNHLKSCIDTSGNDLLLKINPKLSSEEKQINLKTVFLCTISFFSGILISLAIKI